MTVASPSPPSTSKAALDSYGVAELLEISVHTVRSWRKRDIGPPYYKFEGIIRYRYDEVVEWRERRRRGR